MHAPLALAAAAGLAVCSAAHGQTLNWINAAGGLASVAANWNPAQAPTAASPLVWNLLATYPVTFTAATPASQSQRFRLGRVTLAMTSPHTVGSGGLVIGDVSGDSATATLTTGVWNTGGICILGRSFGATGVLNVNDDDAEFAHTTAGGFCIVGDRGAGTLNITGFGHVRVADRLVVGANVGSNGTVIVDGALLVPPFSRTILDVLGNTESTIGGGGDAVLRIDNGAVANFAGSLGVGAGGASVSSVIIEDLGIFASRLNVAGDFNLGRNSAVGSSGGDGSCLVNAGGSLVVDGLINIGNDPDGGTGLLRLSGACTVNCRGLVRGPGGALDLRNGTLAVDGGPFAMDPGQILQILGATSGSPPILLLRQNAAMTLPISFQLGVNGLAEVHAETGADVTVGDIMALGVNAGSTGVFTLSGAGTNASISRLRIGSSGEGTVEVHDGASLTSLSRTEIGALAGSTGGLLVDQATADLRGNVFVAGRDNGAGGTGAGGPGLFVLRNQASVTCGNDLNVLGQGSLVVDRSTLTLADHAFFGGDVAVIQGSLIAASLEAYGSFAASGTVRARVFSSQPIHVTGDLSLGDGSADALRFVPVEAGAFRVTYLDSTPVEIRNTSVAGGVLVAANGFILQPGESLQGTGRIVGSFRHEGTLTPTGPLGLAFSGAFDHSSGQAISGTRILFESGSVYTGHTASGLTRWHSDPGSRMVFTATSGVGLNVPDGFVCAGELDITGNLFIGDSDGFSTGPACVLRGGAITAQSPLRVDRNGNTRHRLSGAGTLSASVFNTGVIAPGFENADRTAVLTATIYRQTDGFTAGALEIDIEGPAPDQADRLDVLQGSVLDGTLTLRLLRGFAPANGFRRTIFTAGAIQGSFSRPELPPRWHLERVANHIDAVYCAADFNEDSFVDFFDYDDFVNCFETGNCPPGLSADFNGDGFADFFDYDDFVVAFEQGC